MANSILISTSVYASLVASMTTSVPQSLVPRSSALITIERQGGTVLPPLLKSKLGVARATGYANLLATIPYARQIGSRAFCSTISFDQLTDRPKGNYALGRTQFSAEAVQFDPAASRWMQLLIQSLSLNDQQIFLGLVGAPKPYQQALIRKPAAHPTPTNIPAAAKLTATWVRDSLPAAPPINWVVWNEPEHTLRGVNSSAAAGDMANIYRSYQGALSDHSRVDGFGLASFMKASLRDSSDVPSRSFASLVLEGLAQPPRPAIDYITLNNYHGQAFELIARLHADLRRAGMDQPLVLNQFAPAILGSHPALAGSAQVASHYLHSLDRFVQEPGLASACMSFWAGSDRKALLRETRPGTFATTLPFQAFALYQQMPLWRVPVQVSSIDHPYTLWAARDLTRFQVLVLPRLVEVGSGLPAGAAGKAERKLERQGQRRRERQERRRGLPQELETTSAAGADGVTMLPLLLPDSPDRLIQVQRLRQGSATPLREQIRTDASGLLNLPMAPDQIVLLSLGTASVLPSLLPAIRSDLYIHRQAQQQGWASVDAIRDGFVLALPSAVAVAHASATYPAQRPRADLLVQLSSPQGSAGLRRALRCSAIVLQQMTGRRPLTLASWGDVAAAARIRSSRAFANSSAETLAVKAWPDPDGQGRLRLPLSGQSFLSPLRLHLAAEGCEAGTQLQARVLR